MKLEIPDRHSKTLAMAGLYWLAAFAVGIPTTAHGAQASYDLGTQCVHCGVVTEAPPWPTNGYHIATATLRMIDCTVCREKREVKRLMKAEKPRARIGRL